MPQPSPSSRAARESSTSKGPSTEGRQGSAVDGMLDCLAHAADGEGCVVLLPARQRGHCALELLQLPRLEPAKARDHLCERVEEILELVSLAKSRFDLEVAV